MKSDLCTVISSFLVIHPHIFKYLNKYVGDEENDVGASNWEIMKSPAKRQLKKSVQSLSSSNESDRHTSNQKAFSVLCYVFTVSRELWDGTILEKKCKRITPKECSISVFLKP